MAKQKHNFKQKTISIPEVGNLKRNREINLFVFITISIFAFILYGNTLTHDYALDDAIVITNNKFTQKGFGGISNILKYDTFVGFWLTNNPNKSAEQIQEEKKLVAGGRYRPLSLISFAIELEFFGKNIKDESGKVLYKGNPFISHFFNIILYLLTSYLLFLILSKLFPPEKDKKWYLSFPFIASILFLAHPLHTEAVANIKGRDEIMTLLGSLAALWFTIKYLDTKKFYYLIASSTSLFLGLLSKENAISFLAIIPITVYYFTKHNLKSNFKSLTPLLIVSAIFLLIRASVLGMGGGEKQISQEIMNNPFIYANSAQKMATIFFTLWLYIKLLFYPHPLTYDYYPWQIEIINWANPKAFLPLILYLVLGIYAVYGLLKKKDIFSYSIWFYLLPLSVVSNIFFPVGTFMNERFIFISSIGFCIFIAVLLAKYLPKFIKNSQTNSYISILILISILSLYSFKTIDRNKAWKNDLSLFTTDVKTSTNSAKSNCSAGGKLIEEAQKPINKENKEVHDKMINQAIIYLERALEIYPEYIDALNLLGNAYYELNYNVYKALSNYAEILKLKPYHSIAYGNSQIVLQNTIGLLNSQSTVSTPDDIIAGCEEILKIHPEFGEANHVMGTMYGKHKNMLDSSLFYLEKANQCNFYKDASFYRDLGVAYGMSAQFKPALDNFLKSLELDSNDFQTYFNVGITYQQLGDFANANLYFQKAQEIQNSQNKQ
ncbi:MAG: glycosyltransferase family 39 protein [Bacteroidales bacterium]|nr:glycosyltransferase family 39 protein [Bacteroidales bacterium]